MKGGRIFWGTLFVVLGGLILIDNFISVMLPWDDIWRFWPVILIFIGISALTKGKEYNWILNAVIAILAGLILFSWMQSGCSRIKDVFESNNDVFTDSYHISYDSTVKVANFRVDGGAGSYKIEDTTGHLLLARTRSSFGHYTLKENRTGDMSSLAMSLKEKHISWQGGKIKNSVKISLNPEPLWKLDLNLGAAAVNLDLTPYRIREMNMDAGAASIDVKLGIPEDEMFVTIDAGASSIHILVPDVVGCEIRTEAELSSHEFTDFTETSHKLYRTKNFDHSERQIRIKIDAGISKIVVDRYTPDNEMISVVEETPESAKADSVMF